MLNDVQESLPVVTSRRPHHVGPARRIYDALSQPTFSARQTDAARDYLKDQLALARELAPELPSDMHDVADALADHADNVGLQYRAYLAERKAGAPRRYFTTRAHALHFIRGVAPTKLVDGAWLYGLLSRSGDARYTPLVKTYLEELGDGDPGKNHVVLYNALLDSNDCNTWQTLNDDHFVQGAIQLALATHADEFLPEIIGFNLGYEQLPLHLLITSYELNELGIDPYYFTLHVTIDNGSTGHAHRAVQGMLAAAPKMGDRDAYYQRVVNGYMLNSLGASTESVIKNYSLDAEVLDVLVRKADVGKLVHSDYCRVGGRSVTDWLAEPDQIPGFLAAMEKHGWIKRHQDPQNSRFWKLLQGERAEMFGVFDGYERQVIHDWIAGDALMRPAPRVEGQPAPTFPPRQLSFRARQRLFNTLAVHDDEAVGTAAVEAATGYNGKRGGEPASEELREFEDQLASASTPAEARAHLIAWMSPALHHTEPGLLATRRFSRQLDATMV
ncbi:iron-containing redox enzyme family protein [Pigmentiphaga litoralis]|uniref:iron-containing redox enzyme family protein n=1 Tax=Pigmentiphaga litoralis TaxID=516702 RepID=UPI0016799BA2|nr:iron-containing redox enzyme family protein [Pigmentiphaga litoralis]